MSITLSGPVTLTAVLDAANVAGGTDLNSLRSRVSLAYVFPFTSGSALALDVDAIYSQRLTITQAAASVTLDLTTILDYLGAALALTTLKLLIVKVTANAQNDYLELSGGTSNPFEAIFAGVSGGKLRVTAGGCLPMIAPIGHTVDGTHKTLKFLRVSGGAPDTADLVVDVVIAGVR